MAETSIKRPVRWKKLTALAGISFGLIYGLCFAGFDYAMHQPPDEFGRVMMHVGPVPFLLFPFETMWKSARAGSLHPGDLSADFTLPLLGDSGSVTAFPRCAVLNR